MTTHDRNVLVARLLISCGVLLGPTMLVVALVVYAVYRGEETHPWSHRSVASIDPIGALDEASHHAS